MSGAFYLGGVMTVNHSKSCRVVQSGFEWRPLSTKPSPQWNKQDIEHERWRGNFTWRLKVSKCNKNKPILKCYCNLCLLNLYDFLLPPVKISEKSLHMTFIKLGLNINWLGALFSWLFTNNWYLGKGKVCILAKWLIRPEFVAVSVAWSD